MTLAQAAIDVHPPRARAWAKSLPRPWLFRRLRCHLRDAVSDALAPLAENFSEYEFSWANLGRALVPGWPQWHRGQKAWAQLLCGGFLALAAGSLLTALKLPELITTTLADYEERAVLLAANPVIHSELKQRLLDGRKTSPLFDMPRFVRDFEKAVSEVAIKPATL